MGDEPGDAMSEQDNRNDGCLVPSGRRDLATVAAANSLVSRGIADLAHGGLLRVSDDIPPDPKDAAFYYARVIAWLRKKDYDKAIKDFDEAMRLDPDFYFRYSFRGRFWLDKKEYDKTIEEAIRLHDEAIRLHPNDAFHYSSRGNFWLDMKDRDKAIKDFKEAIRLDPKDVDAIRQLAWLLATCPEHKFRNGKHAVQLATVACELTDWKSGLELDTLAAAYAEAGEFHEAERYQTMALADADYQGPSGDEFRQRLELYKRKKPHRENG